ncbi:Di-copper centre-containing protein [Conidiobolus coronatus NRRL 28638]|uniref:Di-copper centre-containing protein n=1 Tax=Conidiobolus coronatus (strain ATCC 28846 / CBS 209.66 / NRRL 28638) TaxID=796925 RepID=A0A137P667_CONC2|nr:Di-copper centre-containing protein [Conidiobolus coronatus NRRL 28638]|eukprot:KXN70486.1 Di-copper centre-containing protein [Conidiobolus coronatus NRRL 28638]
MQLIIPQLILLLFQNQINCQGCPNGIRIRPNYLTMSPSDRQAFHSAINQLYQNNNAQSIYNNFTKVHYDVGNGAHNTPNFFPWHRVYIRLFEIELQKINPSIMLPYWDWSRDSQAPERSRVFYPDHMGGNGGPLKAGGCLMDGPFSGWQTTVPVLHCVSRFFKGGKEIPAWHSSQSISSFMDNDRDYNTFHQDIEPAPHGSVHVGIGGNGGDMSYMNSPADPIFWLHHTFVDLIWREWSKRNPNGNKSFPNANQGMAVYGVPPSSVFDTTVDGYCYDYPRWSVNMPNVDPNTPPQSPAPANTDPHNAPLPVGDEDKPCNSWLGLGIGCKRRRQLEDLIESIDLFKLILDIVNWPGYLNPLDRSKTHKIRVPFKIPEAYLKMMNIPVKLARKAELKSSIVSCKLNLIPGYDPQLDL